MADWITPEILELFGSRKNIEPAISMGGLRPSGNIPTVEDEIRRRRPQEEPEPVISEPSYPTVIGKGLMRSGQGILGGIGSMSRWGGDIIGSPRLSELGKESSAYWQEARQEGIFAPDPELFKGSFLDKPSLKRAVGIISEAVPSLAVALSISAATGQPWLGAGALGLLEGAPQYEEAREAGKGLSEASAYGAISTAGTALLEYLPISRMLKFKGGFVTGLAKGGVEESAQEATQSVWQNLIAKFGYDNTQKLSEGIVESMIGGFGAGGVAGGTVAKLNQVADAAKEAGISDDEIDRARKNLEDQVIKRSEELSPGEEIGVTEERILTRVKQDYEAGTITTEHIDGIKTRFPALAPELDKIVGDSIVKDIIDIKTTEDPETKEIKREELKAKKKDVAESALKDVRTETEEPRVIKSALRPTLEEQNQLVIDMLGTRSGLPLEEQAPSKPRPIKSALKPVEKVEKKEIKEEKPTAEFVKYMEYKKGEPVAFYEILSGPNKGSTVSTAGLIEQGIEVPETPEAPTKTIPVSSENIIFKAKEIDSVPGALISLRDIKKAMPEVAKEDFDKTILQLAEDEKVWLHTHAQPSTAKPEDVVVEGDDVYMGLVIREKAKEEKPVVPEKAKEAIDIKKEYEEFKAKEPTIEEEIEVTLDTGEKITLKRDVRKALKENNQAMDRYNKLLECLGS